MSCRYPAAECQRNFFRKQTPRQAFGRIPRYPEDKLGIVEMWQKRIAKVLLWLGGVVCLAVMPTLWAAEPVMAEARARQESLDLTTLRAIFTLRKRRWSDGQPIRVFVLDEDSDVHQAFVKNRLRMFPYQLRQHWNRVVFSGTGPAPQSFEDEAAMLEALVSTPNAIGYSTGENLPEGVVAIEVRR